MFMVTVSSALAEARVSGTGAMSHGALILGQESGGKSGQARHHWLDIRRAVGAAGGEARDGLEAERALSRRGS